MEQAFTQFEKAFTTSQILKQPDHSRQFVEDITSETPSCCLLFLEIIVSLKKL